MNRYLLTGAILGTVAIAGNASATLITFDDGQPNGTAIGSFYSGLGVEFSNAQWRSNSGLLGTSGTQGVRSISSGSFAQPANPIVATFTTTVSTATLRGIDVGYQGFRLNAYDSANNLIDAKVVFGTDLGADQFYDLTVTGAISKITFSQDNPGDGVLTDASFYEDLSFTNAPVPEPATMATLGLGALALLRKRRARK